MKRELKAETELDALPEIANGGNVTEVTPLPQLISRTELYQGQIIALPMLLESLLWAGLTMLVAKPKAGKSWLTLQIAVQIAGGRPLEGVKGLGYGPVLYCALEEPAARTKARLRKIAPLGEWAANLNFAYELKPLMGGGADQLAALIRKTQPRLVIVDTFTALVKTGSKSGSDVFRSQYAEVSVLRKLSEELGAAILVVHHVRKGPSDGAIEAVAGTGGIAASRRHAVAVKRKPEGEATLDIVGRETEERTLALQFQQDPFGWCVLGDDAIQLLNGERRQVLDLLIEEGGLTPAQIATELGKSRPAIRMLLKRMRDDNQVQKQGTRYFPHTP